MFNKLFNNKRIRTNKLSRSKKGINDISISWGIFGTFILLTFALPFLYNAFNVEHSVTDTTNFQNRIGDEARNVPTIQSYTILEAFTDVFFWSFGTFPDWLETVFLTLRIMLYFLVARNIWIGGGG